MKININITLNSEPCTLEIDTRETLLEVLRNKMGLKSVHRSCLEGECGACTVLVDEKPVNSCLVLAATVDNKKILTSEGLEQKERIHPLMQAFIDNLGFQCGYCTPGILMNAYALLNREEEIDDQKIRKSLEGNLCRCTGYVNIVKSVQAAKKEKDSGNWW